MQRKYGVVFGYISMFLFNITSFLLTPMMIYTWGGGGFGAYKLVVTITAYFMLLDLGIGNAIIRFLSEFRETKNIEKERNFVAAILYFYALVSLILLLIGFYVQVYFERIFVALTLKEVELAKLLFTVTIINAAVNLFFNSFNAIIKVYEKYIFLNGNNLLKNAIRFFLMFFLLKEGKDAYSIVIADLIINLVFGIVNLVYVFLILNVFPRFRGLKFEFIKHIYGYSFFVFIEMIAYQMFWSVDNIILGILTSSMIIAVYSIGTLFISYFESLAGVIHSVTMPRIVQLVTLNSSNEVLVAEIVKIARIKVFVLGLPLIGFIFLGQKFIQLWAGKDFLSAYYIAIIVVIPQVIARVQDVAANVMWAKNKQKQKAFISIFVSIMNVFITVILVQKIGVLGAAIGTAFAFFVGYILYEGIYIHKILGLNMIDIYKQIYKGSLISLFIISILSWLISKYDVLTWKVFTFQSILITFIYIGVMWRYALNDNEKKWKNLF